MKHTKKALNIEEIIIIALTAAKHLAFLMYIPI